MTYRAAWRARVRRADPYLVTGFLILIVTYGYFLPLVDNVNSTSRMNLIYAVSDQGTIRIDDFHRNTIDKAYFEGHYYTEKSIGPSVVGLPVYIAARTLAVSTGLTDPPETWAPGAGYTYRYHAVALFFVTFFTVSLPSAVAAGLLYRFVRRWVPPGVALTTMLAYGLGTIAFAYSNQFYSHQMAGAALFAGFYALWRVVEEDGSRLWAWVGGALLGFAVITEYVTAVFAALMLMWALYRTRAVTVPMRVAAAALPWGLLAAAYNLAAFRIPLPAGYAHTANFSEVHTQGVLGLTWPTWASVYGITFSPYRGLFLMSPFLLLALWGFPLMWRAGQRALVLLLGGICAGMLLYNASYVVWWGGFSIGPRHLVPMLPFLCVPVAVALQAARSWRPLLAGTAMLIAASIVIVWIQTVGGADFPAEGVEHPLLAYSLPRLLQGEVALNLGMLAGLEGHASLLPWIALIIAIPLVVRRIVVGAAAEAAVRPTGV